MRKPEQLNCSGFFYVLPDNKKIHEKLKISFINYWIIKKKKLVLQSLFEKGYRVKKIPQ